MDTGPHVIDLLEQILGPISRIKATQGPLHWAALTMEHAGGSVSQISLCSHTASDPLRFEVEAFNEHEAPVLDVIAAMGPLFQKAISSATLSLGATEACTALAEEFVQSIHTAKHHALSATHGLHIQHLLQEAMRSLDGRIIEEASAQPLRVYSGINPNRMGKLKVPNRTICYHKT